MKKLLSLSLLLIFLFSCASDEEAKGRTKAESIYNQAKIMYENKSYLSAIERLNVLRSQHPYSYYATPAELLLADIKFAQSDFIEAAASYMAFRDLHPKHIQMDYIIFRIAESYFNQMPSTYDRDLTTTHEALKYYKELLRSYPKSQYVKSVNERVDAAETMIEEKEKYIADFYFKTENFEAAKYRYLKIIKEFSRKDLVDYSKIRVAKSWLMMKKYKECIDYIKDNARSFSEKTALEATKLVEDCAEELKTKKQG
jgi:outer membrane protein assembly factor BamD